MAGQPYWAHTFTEQPRRRPVAQPGQECKGGCNAAWRRQQRLLDAYEQALKTRQDGPGGPPPKEPETRPLSPWPGEPVFCTRCQAVYRRLLSELDDLAAIATRYNDGHRKNPETERVSGTARSHTPSATAEDLDLLAHTLRNWEAVARHGSETVPRRGYLATELTTVIAWLVSHFDTLICDPGEAEKFADDISRWHQQFKATTKSGSGRRHMKRPCPRCDRFSLYQEDDADYVACRRPECGRLLSWPEWLAWSENFPQTALRTPLTPQRGTRVNSAAPARTVPSPKLQWVGARRCSAGRGWPRARPVPRRRRVRAHQRGRGGYGGFAMHGHPVA